MAVDTFRHTYAHRKNQGQMTVELCVVFPVVMAIAVMAANALTFFGQCASFDRVARNAVRTFASSPEAKAQPAELAQRIQQAVQVHFEEADVACNVQSVHGGLSRYEISTAFQPTLFGMGLRESVWGVPLPKLQHSIQLTLDSFSPHKQVLS